MKEINFKEKYLTILKANKGGFKYRGFVMLPHSLVADSRLKRADLLLFWALTIHLFKDKEYCYPSYETLAKEAHMTRRTAIRASKNLQKFGYLKVEKIVGHSNKFYLTAEL